ncbi:MAG TPA: hypothetical protein VLC95_13110 [Anaerolineae bacterium]|nr:hypothetical protein [Anaerolineae bacterium]
MGDIFTFLAGTPAIVGLVLTAAVIFLTSNSRLALSMLGVQYLLAGLVLTRSVQPELAVVRILVGVLVVPILYLTIRHVLPVPLSETETDTHAHSLSMDWSAGPLGLPLRVLTILLLSLALMRFFPDYQLLFQSLHVEPAVVTPDVALVAVWLIGVGAFGLILSGEVLRVAPGALTILTGFDLLYAHWNSNLAVVGFWSAFTLLAALAFSYLAAVQGLTGARLQAENEEVDR